LSTWGSSWDVQKKKLLKKTKRLSSFSSRAVLEFKDERPEEQPELQPEEVASYSPYTEISSSVADATEDTYGTAYTTGEVEAYQPVEEVSNAYETAYATEEVEAYQPVEEVSSVPSVVVGGMGWGAFAAKKGKGRRKRNSVTVEEVRDGDDEPIVRIVGVEDDMSWRRRGAETDRGY